MAYAILACLASYKTISEQAALQLAQESFAWIYRYARDSQHGGYFGDLRRDGTVIRDGNVEGWASGKDALVVARALTDHALRYGWDRRLGGIYFAALGPLYLQGQNLLVRKKLLWVQMGALKTLFALHGVAPKEERYLQGFKTQWRYIQDHLVDRAYGGFHTASSEALPWWRRRRQSLAPASVTRKGSVWKDSSHDGHALLYCMSRLKDMELTQSIS